MTPAETIAYCKGNGSGIIDLKFIDFVDPSSTRPLISQGGCVRIVTSPGVRLNLVIQERTKIYELQS